METPIFGFTGFLGGKTGTRGNLSKERMAYLKHYNDIMKDSRSLVIVEPKPQEAKKKAKFFLNDKAIELVKGYSHIMLSINYVTPERIVPIVIMPTNDGDNKASVLLNQDGSFHSKDYHALVLKAVQVNSSLLSPEKQHVFEIITKGIPTPNGSFYLTSFVESKDVPPTGKDEDIDATTPKKLESFNDMYQMSSEEANSLNNNEESF